MQKKESETSSFKNSNSIKSFDVVPKKSIVIDFEPDDVNDIKRRKSLTDPGADSHKEEESDEFESHQSFLDSSEVDEEDESGEEEGDDGRSDEEGGDDGP